MDVGQSETPPDDIDVPEALLDLPRPGVGDDIEVFRVLPQHHVADCSPGQIGDETLPVEAIKDFEDIRVDIAVRDRVPRSF